MSLKKSIRRIGKVVGIGAAIYFGAPYLAAAVSAAAPYASAAGSLLAARARAGAGAPGGGGTVVFAQAPPQLTPGFIGGESSFGSFAPSGGGGGFGAPYGPEPSGGISPGLVFGVGGGILAVIVLALLIRR